MRSRQAGYVILRAALCCCILPGAADTFARNVSVDSLQIPARLEEIVIARHKRAGDGPEKENAGIQTATDALLRRFPGVGLIRRGNFAPEPVIRSMSAGQINVTLDGMKIFGACTDRMDPASTYIEPGNLQSIRMDPGPGMDAQGSTVGGGIDFRLKTPALAAARRLSGLAGTEYQTNGGAVQALASLQYSTQRLAVLADGLYRSASDYTAGGGRKIAFSGYHKWNGHVAAKYRVTPHSYLLADYIRDEGYDIGYPALLMDVQYAKAGIGSLTYRYEQAGKKLYKWEVKAYANAIDHAMDDRHRPASQVPVHMDMPGRSRTAGAYAQAFWTAGNKNAFRAKAEVYQSRLHAEMTMYPDGAPPMFMLTLPDGERQVAGVDLSDALSLPGHWEAVVGARLEYARTRISSSEGRAQVSSVYAGNPDRSKVLYNAYIRIGRMLSPHWNTALDLAKGMRNSTLNELYGIYLFSRADNYDYIGNPALKTEQSYSGTLSATGRYQRLEGDARVFAYFLHNYITGIVQPGYMPMTAGASGVKQYTNLSSATLWGAELRWKWVIAGRLHFSSTTTYMYGQDALHRALPLVAPLQAINTLSYEIKGWSAMLESVAAAAQRHVSPFYGETATPGFHILNLQLEKTFSLKATRMACGLDINNILDRQYYEHLDILQVPRPGRSFTGRVTLFF